MTHDVQKTYRNVKTLASRSTVMQLSDDTLLKYTTTSHSPGDWYGSSHDFVLHEKEQVMWYETLELTTAVDDISVLSYVKQIGDLDVARKDHPLMFEEYPGLMLSEHTEYD